MDEDIEKKIKRIGFLLKDPRIDKLNVSVTDVKDLNDYE